MKRGFLIFSGILLITAFTPVAVRAADSATTLPATQPTDAAIQTTQQYWELIRTGQAVKAVETYWDFQALFDAMFGSDMKNVTAGGRAEMTKILVGVMSHPYIDSDTADALAKCKCDNFEASEMPDHRVLVKFNVSLGNGTVFPVVFYFASTQSGWRIVDTDAKDKTLTETIHGLYFAAAKRLPPLEFVRAMATPN